MTTYNKFVIFWALVFSILPLLAMNEVQVGLDSFIRSCCFRKCRDKLSYTNFN